MKITSSAFSDGESIPVAYTQHGENCNPPLAITTVPANAKSLLLIVDDPDAPNGTFTHWVLFNIDPHVGVILDNTIPPGAVQGKNSAGQLDYRGPKPPSGTHRYYFRLQALDSMLSLPAGASREEIEQAATPHAITDAYLLGRYTAGNEHANAPRS